MIASVRNVRLNLSKYLAVVQHGEEVVVKNRNVPVARIVPYKAGKKSRRFPDLSALRAKQPFTTIPVEILVREDRDARG